MRFYPQPAPPRVERETSALDAPVLFRTAEEVAASLDQKSANEDIEAQHESITIWAPMTDGFAARDARSLRPRKWHPVPNAAVGLRRDPCALLKSYDEARASHTRCKRPHRPGEVLSVLVAGLREQEDPRAALKAHSVVFERVSQRSCGATEARF